MQFHLIGVTLFYYLIGIEIKYKWVTSAPIIYLEIKYLIYLTLAFLILSHHFIKLPCILGSILPTTVRITQIQRSVLKILISFHTASLDYFIQMKNVYNYFKSCLLKSVPMILMANVMFLLKCLYGTYNSTYQKLNLWCIVSLSDYRMNLSFLWYHFPSLPTFNPVCSKCYKYYVLSISNLSAPILHHQIIQKYHSRILGGLSW